MGGKRREENLNSSNAITKNHGNDRLRIIYNQSKGINQAKARFK